MDLNGSIILLFILQLSKHQGCRMNNRIALAFRMHTVQLGQKSLQYCGVYDGTENAGVTMHTSREHSAKE